MKTFEQQHSNNPYCILYDIFQEWLTADEEVSWKKLVKGLKDVRLVSLATDIEKHLK